MSNISIGLKVYRLRALTKYKRRSLVNVRVTMSMRGMSTCRKHNIHNREPPEHYKTKT